MSKQILSHEIMMNLIKLIKFRFKKDMKYWLLLIKLIKFWLKLDPNDWIWIKFNNIRLAIQHFSPNEIDHINIFHKHSQWSQCFKAEVHSMFLNSMLLTVDVLDNRCNKSRCFCCWCSRTRCFGGAPYMHIDRIEIRYDTI